MKIDIRQKQASELANIGRIYVNSQETANLKVKIETVDQYSRGLEVKLKELQ